MDNTIQVWETLPGIPAALPVSAQERAFTESIKQFEAAVVDADAGQMTNIRKLELLAELEEVIPRLSRAEIPKAEQIRLEGLCERLLAQGATVPLRRLTVSVISSLYRFGDTSSLSGIVSRLLKLAGEQNKKIATNTKVAALHIVGDLMVLHDTALESFGTDIVIVIVKHMKFTEANVRCLAFQCLRRTMHLGSLKTPTIASNIWKMLQKLLVDKIPTVRTAAAQALATLAETSPDCACNNGEAMSLSCLKALTNDDQPGVTTACNSECRFAFSTALAQILAAMATPTSWIAAEKPKKKPIVTDLASALEFLEHSAQKGPVVGPNFVGFRAAICLATFRLTEILEVSDSASIVRIVRMLLTVLDVPPSKRSSTVSREEEDNVAQLARQVSLALRQVLGLADSEACLLEVIEQGLVPLVSAQFHEASRGTDIRMVIVLETLSGACISAGEGFRSLETKISKPLLHLVGNYPNPLVQLHATYCLRAVARSSPSQLVQLMSELLKLATVQNAELLGTGLPRRRPIEAKEGMSATPVPDMQPLLRGLFGHSAALSALVGELFQSKLGVPHDITSAVLGTARALLQQHPDAAVSAQRRSCAFLLLEGLMCLGTDWVGQRLSQLFTIWKGVLGKKPIDRIRSIATTQATDGTIGSSDTGSSSALCRDELFSLFCALRSLYAFTLHSRDTLILSLPQLHKILVVFLTNVSQLTTALPHPGSPSVRAKYRQEMSCGAKPTITMSGRCGIPEILLMIRSTMYRTFDAMLPTQYSSRFVPLLNMLADDVSRGLPVDFPQAEFIAHFLPTEDLLLDIQDLQPDQVGRDSSSSTRLAVGRLLGSEPTPRTASDEKGTRAGGCGGSCQVAASRAMPVVTPPEASNVSLLEATAACFFSGAPREGPNSIDGFLMPWDAWFDPTKPLALQCTSADWEWRRSAIWLLSSIMNSGELNETPLTAVLTHLIKKPAAEDPAAKRNPMSFGEQSKPATSTTNVIPSLAILVYLRESALTWGRYSAPPATVAEGLLQSSLEGLKDSNPVVRRLHVETLAWLFYIHHQNVESPAVASVLELISAEGLSSEPTCSRAALAFLCGSLLRVFAQCAAGQPEVCTPAQESARFELGYSVSVSPLRCPYLSDIIDLLLRFGKETSQPVRLWMLHAVRVSLDSAGPAIASRVNEVLKLATAHLLADFFESPLVLCTIAEITLTTAAKVLTSASEDAECSQKECVVRTVGIWNELKHLTSGGAGVGCAFGFARTDMLVMLTAKALAAHNADALGPMRDVFEQVSIKFASRSAGGAFSPAVRMAAAECLAVLVAPPLFLGSSSAIVQEPVRLFALLETARGGEANALQYLIRVLLSHCGLRNLPVWLQTLKEIVLAQPPKMSAFAAEEAAAATQDAAERDEHDDGAAIAGNRAEKHAGDQPAYRAPSGSTRVFATTCVRLLLGQADPDDASHFQTEMPSDTKEQPNIEATKHCLVTHLETFVALAVHASSSDESSLAKAGLRLMLLIIERFQHTRDLQGNLDGGDCPLLLVQFEAQLTACIRHNLRPQANPSVVRLSLELLRDVITARACNSTQRLLALMVHPFGNSTFEPDPLFCEGASTRTFLYRLCCACEILDGELEEPVATGHLRDFGRWIEHALRDGAVLLAALPLQSVKTYQPLCFSLTDYKAMQPYFREALPMIVRGICVLYNAEKRTSLPPAILTADLAPLALGVISLLLDDRTAELPASHISIYTRCLRRILVHPISVSGAESVGPNSSNPSLGNAAGQATITLKYFMDLVGCVWHLVFRIPKRCEASLPDVVEFMHTISGAIWRHHRDLKQARKQADSVAGDLGKPMDNMWLDSICSDTEEGKKSFATIGVYALHVVAAALRCPTVLTDAGRVAQVLELYLWWLQGALPRAAFEGSEEDEFAAAINEIESGEEGPTPDAEEESASSWLWVLFNSPFPVELIHTQPATTLKYWKLVCAVLSAPSICQTCEQQMIQLALIANKLLDSLSSVIKSIEYREGESDEEKRIVFLFALLAPVVTSLCGIVQRVVAGPLGGSFADCQVKGPVRACFSSVSTVFAQCLEHGRVKVVKVAVSTTQSLLQHRACTVLCPMLVRPLMVAVMKQVHGPVNPALEGAWAVISSMVAAWPVGGGDASIQATTRMVLQIVLCIVACCGPTLGVFSSHRAAIAQCLLEVARVDQAGLKAEVACITVESQQTIQMLLREHMTTSSRGGPDGGQPVASPKTLVGSKIELKLKF